MLEVLYQPLWLAAFVGVLGAMIGSFLNVVILRMPLILEAQWLADSRDFLGIEGPEPEKLSLAFPASYCPACKAPIRAWHNIPVFGWLFLRGKAACCGASISAQYPVVELSSAALSVVCALHFGPSWQLAAALVFTWILLAAAVIDLNTQLLPDDLTLSLMWLGLLLSLLGLFCSPPASIIGAAAGYGCLWAVAGLFRLIRGVVGMAAGDFKLLAALGAWLGWKALPEIILLSSLVGAVVGIMLIVFRRQERSQPIPFGPYLAGAGWIALMWGDSLREGYFHAAGISG
jgi:leader peptidase (prepilin peptidase)/N-methyltransferase